MYCSICGTEVKEGAAFCQKCGARLIESRNSVEASAAEYIDGKVISNGNKDGETAQQAATAREAYELLRKNAALCPEVRTVALAEHRDTAVVVGKINRYSARFLNGQVGLNSFPVFPFVIPNVLVCLSTIMLFVGGYMSIDYSTSTILGIYGEDLILPALILMLLAGLSGIGVSVFGNKEKKIVLPFIRKVLGRPKYIEQFEHIEMILYSTFAIVGLVLSLLRALAE